MTLLLLSHVLVYSRVDVGVEFFDRRLLALISELGDLVYGLLHLVLYLLEPVLIEDASFEELMLEEADWVAFTPLFDLVFRPILLEEVRCPMRRCTVRDHLDGVGLAGLPDLLRDSVSALEDRFQVHTIDFLVLYAIGVELSREIGHGCGTGDGCAHAVLVVLNDKEGCVHPIPAPESCQVGSLEERPDVYRPVAEIELADLIGLLVAQGVAHAYTYGHVPADDAPTSIETVLDVEEVHRATLALGEAGPLAVELGHGSFGVAA